MKKIISILLAVFMMTGLLTAAFAETRLEGRPWSNPELPGNLPAVHPAAEENYYLHVNYDLQQAAEGLCEEDSIGKRAEQKVQENLWNMVNNGESTEAKVLRILTSLIMDGERRTKDGFEPLMQYVRRVRETKTLEELSALCREENFLFGTPYAIYQLERSRQDPSKFAVSVTYEGIVPNLETQEDTEGVPRDTKRVEEELALIGYDDATAKQLTERLVEFQIQCESSASLEEESDQETMDESLKTCTPLADQLISQGMIRTDGTNRPFLQNMSFSSFHTLQSLYREENLDLFQAIVCLSMIRYAENYLDPATYAKFRGITGEPDLKSAAKSYMKEYARLLTEQAYADAYAPAEMRAEVNALAEEYRQALVNRMQHCEWLSETSRKNAAEKASMMKFVVAVSEDRIDYEPLLKALTDGHPNLLQAAVLVERTNRQLLLRLSGTEHDRSHRVMSLNSMLDTNAVYEPDNNTVFILAGVLMPDFNDSSSRETLLGTLGQTIGHEMSHGFDPSGIQYNGTGERTCILTEEDLVLYRKHAERLMEELSRIELADGVKIDGEHCLVEESADLLGLQLTLDLAKKAESFDYNLFFRTLAQKFFQSFPTREAAIKQYATNPHPAQYVRVNYTVALFDEFYNTYPSVREGTTMYISPADRIFIW